MSLAPTLTCGARNSLRITVDKGADCTSIRAFLLYTIIQDITSCANCVSPKLFDLSTCQCVCSNFILGAIAPPGRVWSPATCSFVCANPPTCTGNNILNPVTCACQCLRPPCQPGFRVVNCACQACTTSTPTCVAPRNWDDALCTCSLCGGAQCPPPLIPTPVPLPLPGSCICRCPLLKICPFGQAWDPIACACKT